MLFIPPVHCKANLYSTQMPRFPAAVRQGGTACAPTSYPTTEANDLLLDDANRQSRQNVYVLVARR